MSEKPKITKSELIDEIDSSWTALQSALDQLTPDQLALIKDAAGWTVKDHVLHMAAWERSVVFLLDGQPRYAGLGISESLYLSDDVEAINAAIFADTTSLSGPEALAQHRAVHAQMMALLHALSNDDLAKSYSLKSGEEDDDEGPYIFNVVYGNTAEHYNEHLGWITALVGENS